MSLTETLPPVNITTNRLITEIRLLRHEFEAMKQSNYELKEENNRVVALLGSYMSEELTVREAAAYMKRSEAWVYSMRQQGKLPVKKVNGFGLRILKKDLDKLKE